MANTNLKLSLMNDVIGLAKEYREFVNHILAVKNKWESVDGGSIIDDSDNVPGYPGVVGSDLKTIAGNLIQVVTVYDAGVDTNINTMLG